MSGIWEKELNTDSSNGIIFHMVFQMCCFIVPSLFSFCRFVNCQTAIGRLITDANGNHIFSSINLLQTDFDRDTVQDCIVCSVQSEKPNNICKQCIANNILFAFLLGSTERPLL